MERVVVLGARRYSFKDEKTGNQVEGTTVTYLTGEDAADRDRVGLEPVSVSAPLSLFADLVQAPALYDLDFRHRPGAKGRVTLSLAAARFVKSVDVASLFAQ